MPRTPGRPIPRRRPSSGTCAPAGAPGRLGRGAGGGLAAAARAAGCRDPGRRPGHRHLRPRPPRRGPGRRCPARRPRARPARHAAGRGRSRPALPRVPAGQPRRPADRGRHPVRRVRPGPRPRPGRHLGRRRRPPRRAAGALSAHPRGARWSGRGSRAAPCWSAASRAASRPTSCCRRDGPRRSRRRAPPCAIGRSSGWPVRVTTTIPTPAPPGCPREAHDAVRWGLERGPVLVQTPRAGYVLRLACDRCRTPARCSACTRPAPAHRSDDAAPLSLVRHRGAGLGVRRVRWARAAGAGDRRRPHRRRARPRVRAGAGGHLQRRPGARRGRRRAPDRGRDARRRAGGGGGVRRRRTPRHLAAARPRQHASGGGGAAPLVQRGRAAAPRRPGAGRRRAGRPRAAGAGAVGPGRVRRTRGRRTPRGPAAAGDPGRDPPRLHRARSTTR